MVECHYTPFFVDTMAMVPNLLHSCLLGAWPSRGAAIRVLRLVSKEMSSTVLAAVQSCTVDIGGIPQHDPERMFGLLSRARLQRLQLNIGMCMLGDSSLDVAQHVVKCNTEMGTLLTSMGAAIHPVTQLSLNVNCTPSISTSITTTIPPPGNSSITRFSLSDVPSDLCSMCERLASSLPHLQRLLLAGTCKDIGLGQFVFLCPKLTYLNIEACTVPIEALHALRLQLPSLSHLTISSPSAYTLPQEVQLYVDTLLPLLSTCGKLKILEMNLTPKTELTSADAPSDITIKCCTEVWDLLPESLVELRCDVELCSLLAATDFISRVDVLTLKEFPAMSLVQLLEYAPLLRHITVTSPTAREVDILPDGNELFIEDWDELKIRMRGGFQLSCPSVYICESGETIKDLLSWLPPMADTNTCTVQFGPGVGDCLGRLANVLPCLTHLTLKSEELDEPSQIMTMQCPLLASLANFWCLEHLGLSMQFKFDHSELMNLLVSLPALKELSLPQSDDTWISASVVEELRAQGRYVVLMDVNQDGFLN